MKTLNDIFCLCLDINSNDNIYVDFSIMDNDCRIFISTCGKILLTDGYLLKAVDADQQAERIYQGLLELKEINIGRRSA